MSLQIVFETFELRSLAQVNLKLGAINEIKDVVTAIEALRNIDTLQQIKRK